MFGEKQFTGVGYPTPVSIPDETSCLTLHIPASDEWWAITIGLLYSLILEWNWQQFEGGLSRAEAAERWQVMLEDAIEVASTSNECGVPISVPTPWWDEDQDVDDASTELEQPWYGYVEEPELPPGELTFIEQAAIWTFTGFLAVATWEIGFAPAILFNTIAPKFLVAVRRGNVGEIIRILVDGEEAARVDTSGYAEGDVIRTPLIGDPALETHDIMLIQVE